MVRMTKTALNTTIKAILLYADIPAAAISTSSWYHDYASFSINDRRSLAFVEDIELALRALCRQHRWTVVVIYMREYGLTIILSKSSFITPDDKIMPN